MAIFCRVLMVIYVVSTCSFVVVNVTCWGNSLTVIGALPGVTLELSVLLGGMGTVSMAPPVITYDVEAVASTSCVGWSAF